MVGGSSTQRGRHDCRGSVLVEAAIVLPLAIFIIAGILDLGHIFQQSTVIYQASRAGARTAGAQTAKQSGPNLAYWCSNGAPIGGTGRCDQILDGDFGVPDGPNIPSKSGLYMACHYIREAGLNPTDWEATVNGPVRQVEDPTDLQNQTAMAWLSVTVRPSPSADRCLFCIQQQINAILLDETSFFPVQCAT